MAGMVKETETVDDANKKEKMKNVDFNYMFGDEVMIINVDVDPATRDKHDLPFPILLYRYITGIIKIHHSNIT